MTITRHIYEIYIKATPEKIWQALTDPAFTVQYFHGTAVESRFGANTIQAVKRPEIRRPHLHRVVRRGTFPKLRAVANDVIALPGKFNGCGVGVAQRQDRVPVVVGESG